MSFLSTVVSEHTVGYLLLAGLIGVLSTVVTMWLKNRGALDLAKLNAHSTEKMHEESLVVQMLDMMKGELEQLRKQQAHFVQRERELINDITTLIDHIALIITSKTAASRNAAMKSAEQYLIQTGRGVR